MHYSLRRISTGKASRSTIIAPGPRATPVSRPRREALQAKSLAVGELHPNGSSRQRPAPSLTFQLNSFMSSSRVMSVHRRSFVADVSTMPSWPSTVPAELTSSALRQRWQYGGRRAEEPPCPTAPRSHFQRALEKRST